MIKRRKKRTCSNFSTYLHCWRAKNVLIVISKACVATKVSPIIANLKSTFQISNFEIESTNLNKSSGVIKKISYNKGSTDA